MVDRAADRQGLGVEGLHHHRARTFAAPGAAGDLLVSKGFTVAGAVGAQNYEEEGGTLTKIVPPEPKTPAAGK